GQDAPRWREGSLEDLEREIVLQVHPDGVDFEASSAYHRLVAELLLAASMAASATGRRMSPVYRDRLAAMARFTAAYTKPDGTAPLWGDHDDARTLPLGPQSIRDHRYLVGLIGLHLHDAELARLAGGSRAEAAWWFGPELAARLSEHAPEIGSQAFPEGGVFIMRGRGDHVFIDCGPVGLAGRGGHGHNDLLSFEAVLDHVPLVTEGGCYVYTADFASRNRDRATLSHNSPRVDGEEINRFPGPEFLWTLMPDAQHELVEFSCGTEHDRFTGRHNGYARLQGSVRVERTIELAHATHRLQITDRFSGEGRHDIEVPLHLHPAVDVEQLGSDTVILLVRNRRFSLAWNATDWNLHVEEGREAASYGRSEPTKVLVWRRSSTLSALEVIISPVSAESRRLA
ncbi:MAG TPA: alginate lyase family protein, partial [Polyangiaceae bacterium]|nr:alginate lyase family protein [Polyangiaceae bacterium]